MAYGGEKHGVFTNCTSLGEGRGADEWVCCVRFEKSLNQCCVMMLVSLVSLMTQKVDACVLISSTGPMDNKQNDTQLISSGVCGVCEVL